MCSDVSEKCTFSTFRLKEKAKHGTRRRQNAKTAYVMPRNMADIEQTAAICRVK
jgi:hypothetical protein